MIKNIYLFSCFILLNTAVAIRIGYKQSQEATFGL